MSQASERLDASREARQLLARARYDLLLKVIKADIDSEGPSDTARRLGISRTKLWQLRVWLGLESGKQWKATGKRTGRLSTKQALLEVQP